MRELNEGAGSSLLNPPACSSFWLLPLSVRMTKRLLGSSSTFALRNSSIVFWASQHVHWGNQEGGEHLKLLGNPVRSQPSRLRKLIAKSWPGTGILISTCFHTKRWHIQSKTYPPMKHQYTMDSSILCKGTDWPVDRMLTNLKISCWVWQYQATRPSIDLYLEAGSAGRGSFPLSLVPFSRSTWGGVSVWDALARHS